MQVALPQIDLTKTNIAIERLLETTQNPRHRFMLMAYYRHRYLEIAGRYKEIFEPEMTVENPVYHFHALGVSTTLEGRDAVEALYRQWTETGQCVMYAEDEQVAVADNFIASTLHGHQFMPGQVLQALGFSVDDPDAMYVYSAHQEMVWPYDDRCRLIGEDVWEVDPDKAVITKCRPDEVITVAMAAEALNPLIKPLPSYDEYVLGKAKTGTGTRRTAAV